MATLRLKNALQNYVREVEQECQRFESYEESIEWIYALPVVKQLKEENSKLKRKNKKLLKTIARLSNIVIENVQNNQRIAELAPPSVPTTTYTLQPPVEEDIKRFEMITPPTMRPLPPTPAAPRKTMKPLPTLNLELVVDTLCDQLESVHLQSDTNVEEATLVIPDPTPDDVDIVLSDQEDVIEEPEPEETKEPEDIEEVLQETVIEESTDEMVVVEEEDASEEEEEVHETSEEQVEESVEEITEEEAETEENVEVEKESEEVEEVTINNKTYYATNVTNGTIYEYLEGGEIGDEIGHYENGIAVLK